jgi:4-diphosphocytidyl-2-C-methyl-D-erythritol kinase
MRVERSSFCKVNLLLNILGKRADGFHNLETIFQPVSLCDRLLFDRAGNDIELACSDAALPTDASNLVWRAAAAFRAQTGLADGVRIRLEKRIPMAAGLGGGSGNAATTLLALNELFGQPLDHAALHKLAAQLGSDVPFFLQTGPALGVGRGEQIQTLAPFPALTGAAILLIHPGFGVATAWAYQNLARYPQALNGESGRAARMLEKLNGTSPAEALREAYNSLEAPVLPKYPILSLFQDFLRSEGALMSMMSGSGSTTFAIAANLGAAETLHEKFLGKFGANYWTAVAAI